MSIKKTTPDNLQVSPSLQIQYAAQVALQRCLILRIDKAYTLYHFPCYLSIDLISNSIFCPTLGGRFTPGGEQQKAPAETDAMFLFQKEINHIDYFYSVFIHWEFIHGNDVLRVVVTYTF